MDVMMGWAWVKAAGKSGARSGFMFRMAISRIMVGSFWVSRRDAEAQRVVVLFENLLTVMGVGCSTPSELYFCFLFPGVATPGYCCLSPSGICLML